MNHSIGFVLICLCFMGIVFVDAENETLFLSHSSAFPPEMVSELDILVIDYTKELTNIQHENQMSAEALAITGISGKDATGIVEQKVKNVSNIFSSLVISPENIVTAAAPSPFKDLIGIDLGYQNETIYANEQKIPISSNIFLLKEGILGISISYPIITDDNHYLGYTDAAFQPVDLFKSFAEECTNKTGYDVYIIQTDGTILYETNEEEIGKNILTDPIYDTPDVRNISNEITTHQNGFGYYTFWDQQWKKKVLRQTLWTTLYSNNQEWRLGIVQDADESKPITTPYPINEGLARANETSGI